MGKIIKYHKLMINFQLMFNYTTKDLNYVLYS